MEIEKAIEFLLEGQAKHEAEIKAIRKVISGGLKLVVKYQTRTNEKLEALLDAQLRTEASLERLAEAQTGLADAQTRTEKELRTLIDSLKHPKNGHGE
jgi:hypothetical protein